MKAAADPELSRLAFEERLIEYCEDGAVPLLERVRLLAIAASRLDTFFMTRVGRLKRLAAVGAQGGVQSDTSWSEQLDVLCAQCHRVADRAYTLVEDDLLPALARNGVTVEPWDALTARDLKLIQQTYGDRLAAAVRPLQVGPTAPFPHVRNLRPAVIALPRKAGNGREPLAVIELPEELPRFIPLDPPHRFVALEDVLGGTVGVLRPDWHVDRVHVFRVTRSAIMDLDADSDDVMEVVEQEVTRRPFQEVVRVEVEHTMPGDLRARLLRDLRREAEIQGGTLDERDLYGVRRLVDLAAFEQLAALELPALKARPVSPSSPNVGPSLLDAVRERDVLARFPFDSYEGTVQRLLDEASRRPDVTAIKITLYRAGKDSALIHALREARARGVDVTAVVELKASFDERENIELARLLEGDGVRVILSPPQLKVHAKIGVIALDAGPSARVAMIGTGNLNATTARSYVDWWLLTADDERAAEVDAVFEVIARGMRSEFKHLLVAPFHMRQRFLELIERETVHAQAGSRAGIRAALNGLTDGPIIAALCRASQAGVAIELMVRGVCALHPGVPCVSENIRVVSVVGSLLQHARVFAFRNGGDDEYFMGSADWRPRNMDHRIEVVTRMSAIHHDRLREGLDETLRGRNAWVLRPDGVYVREALPRRPVTLSTTGRPSDTSAHPRPARRLR